MIAFVLSGGASLGAIQAGMLQALYEDGIAPELIVGTSAGAVNGAYIASRPASVETAAGLQDQWRKMHTCQVFPPNPITAFAGLLGAHDYLVSNSGVKRVLRSHLGFERLQDAEIRFSVVATDVMSGAHVRLEHGDALTAVLASAAIPGVFPSVTFEGRELVDGGVSENTPIADAAASKADVIYVLPTGGPCTLEKPPHGAVQMLVHALTLLINQRLAQDIEQYSQQARLIVFPPPCPQSVPAWDFGHAGELIAQGYASARSVLDDVGARGEAAEHDARRRAVERLRHHHD